MKIISDNKLFTQKEVDDIIYKYKIDAKNDKIRMLNDLNNMVKENWSFMCGILPYNTDMPKNEVYRLIKIIAKKYIE